MTCLCGQEGCHEEEPVQTRSTRQSDKDGQVAEENPPGSLQGKRATQEAYDGGFRNRMVNEKPVLDNQQRYVKNPAIPPASQYVSGLTPMVRTFETGATRDADEGKLDYEGFLAPAVLERYAQYMHKHRTQSDGSLRDSDNWQKGMPKEQYVKSLVRHTIDFWKQYRTERAFRHEGRSSLLLQELACAIMFNIMGWLYEDLK